MFLFKSVPSITNKELQELLAKKIELIDVREKHEFAGGHILGAKNIPLQQISSYKGKGPVYVICQSGMRSKQATSHLVGKGIDAYNVKGGMMQWQGAVKGGK
ncbi:rhodanese-like domain-containing protein [Vagococcus coleopterorum]|uniref:Rhodanese-like domain-containing protein n=1 Tax=Vagococcus coleopterorum TaxID=2714946 RepID=A0A6G8AMG0_9ENTE|nr:rhodanese-like domain-containing protein [Vagococcus coleopterorum]QIL46113.1 rhodanese-like domain-containing protein [Vagococcus coleopterorum]